MSRIAWCFINLSLFEDAIEYCDQALNENVFHDNSLYYKAICMAHIGEFDESIDIFESLDGIDCKKEISLVE